MQGAITEEDAHYAYDLVRAICTDVGPGVPASPQERGRAAILARELASHLGTANVTLEEFALAPRAFLGSIPVGSLLTAVAVLLNLSAGRLAGVPPWLTAAGALVLSALSIVPFVLEYVLYREFVDPLFRQGQSVNVIGTLRPPGTRAVRRLLILSGHHDSAPENTWLRLLGYGFYFAVATMGFGSLVMLGASLVQLVGAITGNSDTLRWGTMGWAALAYPMIPAIVFGTFFTRGWKHGGVVPGAADNLSACALTVALCRFLVKNPDQIPADIEIRFVSFGSEEAGLRGSRRYVARHVDELRRLDARLLNIETVAHPEIPILTSDMNGTVRHSAEMVASVVAAAERAGVPHRTQSATFGVGTDASPFSQAGLRATTLLPFQVPQQTVAFYHQKWDRPEILTIEPLMNVLKLALEWIHSGGEVR